MGEMNCQRGTAMSDVKVKTQNLSFLSKTRQWQKRMGDMISPRGTAMSDVDI